MIDSLHVVLNLPDANCIWFEYRENCSTNPNTYHFSLARHEDVIKVQNSSAFRFLLPIKQLSNIDDNLHLHSSHVIFLLIFDFTGGNLCSFYNSQFQNSNPHLKYVVLVKYVE